MKKFELARRAIGDLQGIWDFVAEDSAAAADGLLDEFFRAFEQLGGMPGIGHKREDLTHRNVLFWSLHSYLIVYRNSNPLRVVRILHGMRDVKKILANRR